MIDGNNPHIFSSLQPICQFVWGRGVAKYMQQVHEGIQQVKYDRGAPSEKERLVQHQRPLNLPSTLTLQSTQQDPRFSINCSNKQLVRTTQREIRNSSPALEPYLRSYVEVGSPRLLLPLTLPRINIQPQPLSRSLPSLARESSSIPTFSRR